MDQVAFDFGSGASPDHGVAGLYNCGLPIILQCDLRSPNAWENQGNHLYLSLDDEVFHFDEDSQSEGRLEDRHTMLHLGYKD